MKLYYLLFLSLFGLSCGKNSSDSGDFSSGSLSDTSAGSLGGTLNRSSAFSFSGRVPKSTVFLKKQTPGSFATKEITHLIAMNPESANPTRFITQVQPDGSFELLVDPRKPYILVFVASDQNWKGPDMIVAILKISSTDLDLDTLAPLQPGNADLGEIEIDSTEKQATLSVAIDLLLVSLGITHQEAVFLGKMDNISLRAANPDIDGNGVIDMLENKNFYMGWHIRAETILGDQRAQFKDALGAFLNNPNLIYNLNSGYAVYPKSYYEGICPTNEGVSTQLAAGCGLDILGLDGTPMLSSWPHTSMSGGSFADMNQWGPDFRPPGEEMPGSFGMGVQMVYTFPGDKKLTFWNVITRSNVSLIADGLMLPFLKFETSDGTLAGTITQVGFEWRKLEAGSWVPATATEVQLIVNDQGGHAMFYTQKSPGQEAGFSFSIPQKVASGTIPWNDSYITSNSSGPVSNATLNSFCSSAVSYDDKLGLRLFMGGFYPNDGVTLCP